MLSTGKLTILLYAFLCFLSILTQRVQVELQQASVSKSTMTIYTLAGAATVTRMNFFLVIFTSYCGYSYNVTLSDSDKPSALYADYIEYFNIDMNQFEPSDYMDYYSVNNWFIRQLKNGSRPIDSPTNNDIVTSAADARVFVFTDLPDVFKIQTIATYFLFIYVGFQDDCKGGEFRHPDPSQQCFHRGQLPEWLHDYLALGL